MCLSDTAFKALRTTGEPSVWFIPNRQNSIDTASTIASRNSSLVGQIPSFASMPFKRLTTKGRNNIWGRMVWVWGLFVFLLSAQCAL